MTETEQVLKERFEKLFEGLDAEEVEKLLVELIDDYTYQRYGMSVVEEIRKVKNNTGCVSIQPLIGKAILVSPYGFEIVSETQHPKGGKRLILQEITKKQREKNSR